MAEQVPTPEVGGQPPEPVMPGSENPETTQLQPGQLDPSLPYTPPAVEPPAVEPDPYLAEPVVEGAPGDVTVRRPISQHDD